MKKSAYSESGVDIDAKMNTLARAKKMIQRTMTPDCVGAWGSFGGLFKAPGKDHLLVSSADGVLSLREAIALAIHLVVHVERVGRARRVTDVAAVSGYDPAGDRICLDPLTSRVTTDAEGGVP